VFSRITTRSTLPCRVGTPESDLAGRTAANRSSSWRSATLMLRNPEPTGVVMGPLMATRDSRIDFSVSSGRRSPCSARATEPAWRSVHSMPETVASRTCRAAADTSGPMPSPGISVTRCRPATSAPYPRIVGPAYAKRVPGSLDRLTPGGPARTRPMRLAHRRPAPIDQRPCSGDEGSILARWDCAPS
jgi:hypothetical protein